MDGVQVREKHKARKKTRSLTTSTANVFSKPKLKYAGSTSEMLHPKEERAWKKMERSAVATNMNQPYVVWRHTALTQGRISSPFAFFRLTYACREQD